MLQAAHAYEGDTVGQVYEGSRVLDLVVVLDPAARNDMGHVGSLQLRAADGRLVLLRTWPTSSRRPGATRSCTPAAAACRR